MAKFEQKLTFYEEQNEFNPDTRQNEVGIKPLFTECCDIKNYDYQQDINGIQTTELKYTHTVFTRYLKDIEKNMWCYRMIRQPDKTIIKQTFKVISYQIYQQDNRYMLLQLNEVVSNGN